MTGGIVVLEGADAAGKTTLARHLVERHGGRYLHGTINRDQWRWNLGGVRYAIKLSLAGHLVVMDRSWPSELVYGAAYRGGPYYDVGARVLDRALRRHGAVYVLCAPDDQERQARRWADGRAAGKHEHFSKVREVIAMYADLARGNVAHPGDGYLDQLIRFGDFTHRDDVLVYDLDREGSDLGRVWRRIDARLHRLRTGGVIPRDHLVPWLGHNLTGRVDLDVHRRCHVFVGDTPGGRWPRPPQWPFADRDTNLSSATWLNRAIHHLALAEERFEIVNAFPGKPEDGDYLPVLAERYRTEPRVRFVALGGKAAMRLIRLGVDHQRIPHPQWHRRFRHGEGHVGYAELIRRAIT